MTSSCTIAGYSGGHAAVIGSVVVSNLTTGIRKGAWEKAEVQLTCTCI
jgi:septum formation protein